VDWFLGNFVEDQKLMWENLKFHPPKSHCTHNTISFFPEIVIPLKIEAKNVDIKNEILLTEKNKI
jgi:hypothetical protein